MKFDWIEEGVLAASGAPIDMKDVEALKQDGIGAIISLTEHPLTIRKSISADNLTALNIQYLHAPVVDGEAPDDQTAETILTFVNEMNARGIATLIHCAAGVGRTGTVLHLYFLARGLTLEESKQRVRSKRPASSFAILSEPQRTFLERRKSL